MRFSEFSIFLERLEKTRSRNAMTGILADFLVSLETAEIARACYLLLGELVPSYRGLEFQIAEKTMMRAVAEACGVGAGDIRKRFQAAGDLGDVAYACLSGRGRSGKSRTALGGVYAALFDIARESGEGSQERRIKKAAVLLADTDPLSAKYITRILAGKLRLGFSDATLLDAFSLVYAGDKSARPAIERAYNCLADIGAIAQRMRKGGIRALAALRARPGIPIRPSLAERLGRVDDILKKVGMEVAVEPKMDGFRTQIHVWLERGARRVALFSRNLERTSAMFPEIADAALRLPVKSAILDSEAIGYHPDTGRFVAFQETVQRKRKHDVAAFAKKIPLAAFVFDVMYLDGSSLLGNPFRERRAALEDLFSRMPGSGALRLAEERVMDSLDVIREELARNVKRGLEGIVVKNLSSAYEAGSRGFHWVKLKARTTALGELRAGAPALRRRSRSSAKADGLADTIDCVVMGGYRGRGKRAQFGVGGLLLGVRGSGGRYYTISRLGTGMSDEQFRQIKRRMARVAAREKPKEYVADGEVVPDIWITPSLVVEILADEITRSPRHTAGRDREGIGYSLRFPRLVRFRDDKKPEDATSVGEIENMYRVEKKHSV